MGRKRYSQEQIIGILKEAESGMPVGEVIRKHGIADGLATGGNRNTAASSSAK